MSTRNKWLLAVLVSVAAVVMVGLLAWVVVSAIRIEGDKLFNPNRQPTPGETSSLGLRIPTASDIQALKAQIAAVPHVTKVDGNYHAATLDGSRGFRVEVNVDLAASGMTTPPDFQEVRDRILRIIWAEPFDVGIVTLTAVDRNGNELNLAHRSLEDMYATWGRPGVSTSASPKPS